MKKHLTRFFICLFSITAVFFSLNFARCDALVVSRAETENVVYLGGKPLGIVIGTEGVIINGIGAVVTENGLVTPLKYCDVKCGDVLLSVGGNTVCTPSDITDALKNTPSNNVFIKIKRGTQVFDVTVKTATDSLSGEKRLGLSVRDDITGVGTLTYVKENSDFGALGHHVADYQTGLKEELNRGNIFDCDIVGAKKGENNRAGELKGVFDKFSTPIGKITKNNDFGIFGSFTGSLSDFNKISVGTRSEIRLGKAYVYTCVQGDTPQFYSIDIVKTNNQDEPRTKSMVISVTDSRLIEKTGGIVQGMSGSPIIQNGKLIGAVTHVFVGDATKGYGLYIDWMLQN